MAGSIERRLEAGAAASGLGGLIQTMAETMDNTENFYGPTRGDANPDRDVAFEVHCLGLSGVDGLGLVGDYRGRRGWS